MKVTREAECTFTAGGGVHVLKRVYRVKPDRSASKVMRVLQAEICRIK